ncbi:hypothetical protein MMC11_005314 [Xylographa trunciseda]|nr:hypothetical protein [Xylographa trunciseda]
MFPVRAGRQLRKHIVRRGLATTSALGADFTHVIIGAGAVGLAVARKLAERDGTSTLLIEKHGTAGTETSSRNSEVIHAGLYYGHDSLKTKLCLQGRHMMYDLCRRENIGHRNTKKWIVAQDDQQWEELVKVHKFARSIDVPTRFLPLQEAHDKEPDVRAQAGVLESESTGIVDSHGLMSWLEGKFQSLGGETAFNTTVTGIETLPSGGFTVHTASDDGSSEPITTETLINSGGLFAIPISNMILPESRQLTPYYAKGTYFSYSASHPRPNTLVYPAPRPGHGGLGTHLTLDLSNPPRVRFGPDVEWVDDPNDYKPNHSRLAAALDEIETYLPTLQRDAVEVDYCGIRPKLGKLGAVASGKGFQDFIIRKEEGYDTFVNLLGIESPGLTSSLAIGEYVDGLLYR